LTPNVDEPLFFPLQNFFQASKYIPDICVIRAIQKIVWASGCGTVQLVFSSNEEISKIYEKVWRGVGCGLLMCAQNYVFCLSGWCLLWPVHN